MKHRRVERKDRFLFNSFWLAEHCFGERLVERVAGNQRRALQERMLRKFARQEKGTFRPIHRMYEFDETEFVEDFVKRGIPVVLDGFAKDWPCIGKWTPDYFASDFGDYEAVVVDRINEGDSPYHTATLRQIVESIRGGRKEYARFIPILHDHPELLEDLGVDGLARLTGSSTGPTSYQFFLGPKDAITAIHSASSSNFFIEIYGEKRWRIFSPENNPLVSPRVDRMPYFISDVDVGNPDYEKYPLLEYADGLETHLKPGDVLYNPPFYWHHITNLTESIASTVRWMAPRVFVRNSPMLTALCVLATKPNLLSAFLATKSGLLMPSWYWRQYRDVTGR